MLSKNKRGFVLTTAVAGIGALLIGLVLVGLLVFAFFNKFAVIGGGLVALTLIFGFKGEFNKAKAIFMGVVILIGLLFVLGGDVLQTQFGAEPDHVFLDAELGLVTFSDDGPLTEQAYFKSASGNSITVSNVGESVKICDVFVDIDNYKYTSFDWATSLNGNTISHQDMAYYANSRTSYCKSWVPTKAGKYEVISHYVLCPDVYGPVQPSSCLSRSSDDTKSYFLTVKAQEDRCDKSAYTGDWFVNEYIDGGQVLYANVYKVADDCSYVVNYQHVQTQCDDGYVIEGTSLHSTSNEGWDCEYIGFVGEGDEDFTDENENGVDDTTGDIDSNCNDDLLVECGDGTSITSKLCSSGFLFDTGAKCSTIGTPDADGDGIGNDVDPDDDNDGILDEDDNEVNSINDGFMNQYGYYLVGGVFILIVVVILVMGRKKK